MAVHHEIEIQAAPHSQSGRASSHSYATSEKKAVRRKQPQPTLPRPTGVEVGQVLKPPIGRFAINVALQVAGIIAAVAFGVFAIKAVTVGNQANGYASEAMELAKMANQLTLLTICLTSNSSTNIDQICSPVIDRAVSMLPDTVYSLFSLSITSLTASATTSRTYSTPKPSTRSSFNITSSRTTFDTMPNSGTSTAYTTAPTSGTTKYASPTATSTGSPSTPSVFNSKSASTLGGIVGGIMAFSMILVAVWVVYKLRTRRQAVSRHDINYQPETSTPVEGAADTPVVEQSTFAKTFRRLFVDTRVVPLE